MCPGFESLIRHHPFYHHQNEKRLTVTGTVGANLCVPV